MKNTMIHNLVKHLPGLKHIKSEFYRGFVLYTFLISAFLTLGVGYAWGDTYCKAASVKYNTGSDQWWEVTSSTKALGTVTTFKLKGFWLQLTGGNVCQGAKMYYSVTGGVNNNYNIQDPQNWSADPKHFQTESMNIDVLSGLSCGNHTLNIWFEGHGTSSCSSLWYSNNSNNYKMSFTIPGFTTTSTSKNFGSVNTGSNSSATISFGNHYGTTLTTSNCSLTNSTDFEVTSISETGVTVKFKPQSAGAKSSTLTITDAHSKTCTISLSGTGVTPSTYYTLTYGVHSSGNGTLAAKNTSTSAAISTGASLLSGTGVTFTATPSSYYEVEGWYTNSACNAGKHDAGNTSYATTITAATTVYVKFQPITYTITYNLNGGTNHASNPATYNYTTATITLQTPTKTGYTFGGWYDNSSFTGSAVTSIPNHSNGNKTFWAKWTENMTSVTLTASPSGAGTFTIGGVAATSTTAGVTTTRSVKAVPACGYKFSSWSKSNSNITLSSTSTNPTTVTGCGTASTSSTLTATFARTYAYIQGRFQVWNAARSGSKTTTYASGGQWNESSTTIQMDYDATNHRFYKHTYMTPKELTANHGTGCDDCKPYFYVKTSTSNSSLAGVTSYMCTSAQTLTAAGNANGKSVATSGGNNANLRFNSTVTSAYVVLYFDQSKIWYELEQRLKYDANGGTGSAPANNNTYYATGGTATAGTNAYTRSGYSFAGWNTQADGNGTSYTAGASITMSADVTLYAQWAGDDYTITLDVDEDHKGTIAGATTSHTVYYGAAVTNIPNLPTAENGYGLDGYYTGHNGAGTKLFNADGSCIASVTGYTDANKKWIYEGDVTLYAYFKKAEIVDLDIDPSLAEKGGTVKVTPVIEPTPAGTTSVCYYLLYMNGNKVDPQPDFGNPNSPDPDIKVSFTAPSIAGTYILAAALRTGSTCGGGTLLDSVATHTFQVGGEYNVTIKYMCGTEVIKAQTTQGANPVEYTSISAPDIFGYTFSTWKLGDGITKHTSDALTKKDNFRFTASYDGTITAIYTKNQYIYLDLSQQFSESGYWNNPYVYFYSANPWNDTYGVGATGHSNYISGHAMTQIGSTGIWYYDYSGVSGACNYVAFTWGNKTGQDNFNYTDVIFRGDFTDGTPLFVPSTGQSKVVKNTAAYYSQGYWVKYLGEETGYRLIIYDAGGTVELKRIGFTSDDKRMTMKAVTDLEAEHTYYYEVYRDDGYYYKNNTSKITPTSRGPKNLKDGTKGTIKTSAAGDYTFTLGYTYSNGYFTISVDYPAVVGDYQFLYGDQASADYWSTGSAHSSTWRHPSRIISKAAGAKDTISFFVVKGASPTLEYRTVKSIATDGVITWNTKTAISGVVDTISKTGVYNFILHQSSPAGSISIEKVEPYTGDFYIRTDAVSNKWDNYTTDPDHLMTYSAFSEDRSQNGFGELFSHYKAKWCPRGTNVKFVIANDYSPCISDTLIKDVTRSWPDNMDATGTLNSDGSADVTKDRWSANIRFMWNRSTNKISRAYVAASTNVTRKFLVLRGCDAKIHDHNNNAIPATTYLAANEVLLEDDQNWIYETMIKVRPTARVKLYACYGEETANVATAQYFRGAYDSGNCNDDDNSIQILGGTGSTYYLMRVIYDFKTNRLITAWLPDGTAVDQAPLNIDADVMVIRDHQQGAEAITFTTNTKSLGQVKTVYGTMRFNRWTLSNRYRSSDTGNPSFVPSTTETDVDKEHSKNAEAISRYHAPLPTHLQTSSFERNNYFISFPFDVQLSEVFGFGTYGTHWIISKYNGLRRAQVGYFRDNCINGDFDCTNWDYIWDRTGVTLKAYEGYLLSLDLDLMQYDDTTNFWLNQIHQVELYFPSKVPMSTITTTNVTLPGMTDDYLCTKNYNKDGTNPEGDRRVKDSYWRCIGVPSYAPYGTVLKTGETEIQWNTDYTWYEDQRSFPFLYEWNTTDNTLTPQRTKTFNFKPLHSYLVQNKNTITWTAVSATPSSIVRRQRTEAQQEYTWRLNLTGDDNDESDTYIRMTDDEEVTEGFDFGPDMIKKFRDGYIVDANGDPIWDSSIDDYKQGVLHSDIYSILGYEYLAANSIPLNTTSTTIIPIGVRLKKAGEFTLSMPDGTYGVSITLVDNNTGARTELGAGFTYSFESEAGQYDDRFYLEIAKIKDIATGTEEIGEPSKSDVRKVMINGILYIVRGDQIFDALGNRVE